MGKRGFTVVEVLIVSAMVVVTGLAMLTMMETGMRASKNNQEVEGSSELIRTINALLSDPLTCNRNFGVPPGQNLSLGATILTADLVDASGAIIYDVASLTNAYPNNLWFIDGYTIQQESVVSTAPVQIEIAKIDFQLRKKNPNSSLGPSQITRSLRLWTQLTTVGGTITSCRSLGVTGNEYWRSNNGTDIFSTNAGNIGIGTTTPQVLLDVNGGIRPGNVGVSIGAACAPEGAIAYDLGAHKVVFCNDLSIWLGVGAGAGAVKVNCMWTVQHGLGSCPPPACPSGLIDAGVIYDEVKSTYNTYNQGHTVRSCYSGSGTRLTLKCPWTVASGFGACIPPACPTGFNPVGTTQEVMGAYAPYNVGNSIRYCEN